MLLLPVTLLITASLIFHSIKVLPRASASQPGLRRKNATSRSRKAQKRHLATLVIWIIATTQCTRIDALLRIVPFYGTARVLAIILACLPVRDQVAESLFRYLGDAVLRPREQSLDEIVEVCTLISQGVATASTTALSVFRGHIPRRLMLWCRRDVAQRAEPPRQEESQPTERARKPTATPRKRTPLAALSAADLSVVYPGHLLLTPYPRMTMVEDDVVRSSPRLAGKRTAGRKSKGGLLQTEAEGGDDLAVPPTQSVELQDTARVPQHPDLLIEYEVAKAPKPARRPATKDSAATTAKKTRSSVNAGTVKSSKPASARPQSRLPRAVSRSGGALVSKDVQVDEASLKRRERDEELEAAEEIPAKKKPRRPGRAAPQMTIDDPATNL